MRNAWIGSVAALALACTVGIGAQTTASPAASTGQSRQDTVTVTGCLKAADAMGGATGTSGSTTAGTTSTAGSSSDRFMLANATMGAASTASTGTSGTTAGSTASTTPGTPRTGTASSAMSATGSSYTLDGDATELRRHMNHQVEIKGRLDSSAGMSSTASRPGTTGAGTTATGTTSNPTGTTATGSTATGTTAGRDAHSSAAQTLRVESVKMIAATCP